jgi:hypothetical protein
MLSSLCLSWIKHNVHQFKVGELDPHFPADVALQLLDAHLHTHAACAGVDRGCAVSFLKHNPQCVFSLDVDETVNMRRLVGLLGPESQDSVIPLSIIRELNVKVPLPDLPNLLSQSSNLSSIFLGPPVDDNTLSAMVTCCRSLRRITLRDCRGLSEDSCRLLCSMFQENSLTHVSIAHSLSLRDSHVAVLLGLQGSSLLAIEFESCHALSSAILPYISQACTRLESLSVVDCKVISPAHIAEACLLHRLSSTLKQLKCCCKEDYYHVTDALITALVPGFGNLENLYLQHCRHLHTDALITCLVSCPLLRVLNVHGCIGLDDSFLQFVAANCPEMRRLSMEECYLVAGEQLRLLESSFSCLTSLHISWCEDLSEQSIQDILCNATTVEKFKARRCMFLSDRALLALSPTFLTRIDVARCEDLTDSSFVSLFSRSPNLTYADLSWTGATNRSLGVLGQSCLQLQTLCLSGCSKVDNRGLELLVAGGFGCVWLQSLSVDFLGNVTDDGVESVIAHNPFLWRIAISFSGIKKVFKHKYPDITFIY